MKMRLTKLTVLVFLLAGITNIFAQDDRECKINISLFHESVKAKNFDEAMKPWRASYENCSKSSIHIYTDGLLIAKNMMKTDATAGVDLVNEIYAKRIENFPNKRLGKVYNDWAKFLIKQGASDDVVFEKLNLAFKVNPAKMSPKNIFRFFRIVTDKYKDTDVQHIFDTMDDVNDAVEKKMIRYTEEYTALNKKIENGEALSTKEQKYVKQNFYQINLKGLGKIEGGLNAMVNDLMTCDRLIPLYRKNYNANTTNAKWLKRAARKLKNKGCDGDALFVEIVESWAKANQSVEVWKYLESIYRKQGRTADAAALGQKIFDMGTPMDKAKFVYSQANDLFKLGKYSQARKKAREVLGYLPSYGRAYMLIGRMYNKTANNVGTDEFSKRMVYVAAAAKMRQAMKADPSLTSTCKKYISNYRAKYPSKALLFNLTKKSGESHRVGGWIGETVRIP